jgi:hypothetical protein
MIFDPLYLILTIPALLFSLYAQFKVKSTFHKYAQVGVRSGMTGADAARAIIRESGLQVAVERHKGFLSDHYDPRAKVLRLSPDVHDGRSISSVAVAAHEAGHSLQDAHGYKPLVLRSKLVPVTQIGSQLWFLPFVLGLMIPQMHGLMWVGAILFSAVVIFQIVTLPTEFNASNRAKAVLASSGIVSTQEEARGVERVLDAAAMTYVAALVASIMQLLYIVMRARSSDR